MWRAGRYPGAQDPGACEGVLTVCEGQGAPSEQSWALKNAGVGPSVQPPYTTMATSPKGAPRAFHALKAKLLAGSVGVPRLGQPRLRGDIWVRQGGRALPWPCSGPCPPPAAPAPGWASSGAGLGLPRRAGRGVLRRPRSAPCPDFLVEIPESSPDPALVLGAAISLSLFPLPSFCSPSSSSPSLLSALCSPGALGTAAASPAPSMQAAGARGGRGGLRGPS